MAIDFLFYSLWCARVFTFHMSVFYVLQSVDPLF
jgi:hypothetical protein